MPLKLRHSHLRLSVQLTWRSRQTYSPAWNGESTGDLAVPPLIFRDKMNNSKKVLAKITFQIRLKFATSIRVLKLPCQFCSCTWERKMSEQWAMSGIVGAPEDWPICYLSLLLRTTKVCCGVILIPNRVKVLICFELPGIHIFLLYSCFIERGSRPLCCILFLVCIEIVKISNHINFVVVFISGSKQLITFFIAMGCHVWY